VEKYTEEDIESLSRTIFNRLRMIENSVDWIYKDCVTIKENLIIVNELNKKQSTMEGKK